MKLNVKIVPEDFDGKPLQRILETDDKGKVLKKEPWTLGSMMISSLMATFDDDKDQTGEEKLHNGQLARKIHKVGDKKHDGLVNIKPEDLKIIKERLTKSFGPGAIVASFEMLDGKVDTLTEEQRSKKKRKQKHKPDPNKIPSGERIAEGIVDLEAIKNSSDSELSDDVVEPEASTA